MTILLILYLLIGFAIFLGGVLVIALVLKHRESRRTGSMAIGHARCSGCGSEIDPEVCWCGDLGEDHYEGSGHMFIPMGCDCHKSGIR